MGKLVLHIDAYFMVKNALFGLTNSQNWKIVNCQENYNEFTFNNLETVDVL